MHIEGDRLIILDTIQRTHTDDSEGDGRLIWTSYIELRNELGRLNEKLRADSGFEIQGGFRVRPLPSRLANLRAFQHPSRRQTTEFINELAERAIALSRMERQERLASVIEFDRFAAERGEEQFAFLTALKVAPQRLEQRDYQEVHAEGTRPMLALEIHEREHGAYPESLDARVPGILPEMPTDPFTGGAFGYRLVDDDEHGRPYLLYSRGAGGVDNRGRHPENNSEVRPWDVLVDPDVGADYDFVINLPWSE